MIGSPLIQLFSQSVNAMLKDYPMQFFFYNHINSKRYFKQILAKKNVVICKQLINVHYLTEYIRIFWYYCAKSF